MNGIENKIMKIPEWIGSIHSLIVHTLLFMACFVLILLGYNFNKVLLTLTTIVSLEAIYLAIFIQMAVNKTNHDLAEAQKDIDEIAEDIEDIEEDIDEIAEDIEDIEEGIGDYNKEKNK